MYIILFGQITNTFISQSFPGSRHYRSESSSIKIHGNDCPLGIDLSSFNYDRMQKYVPDKIDNEQMTTEIGPFSDGLSRQLIQKS